METLLKYLRSYHAVTDEAAEVIAGFFHERKLKIGEYASLEGRVCSELYFIISGVLRIVAVNSKGLDITHYFIGKSQFCTILPSFDNETVAEDSIQACCDTQILLISKRNLLKLYREFPYLNTIINNINQQRMLEKIRLKNIYSGEDAAARYTAFLTEQADVAYKVPQSYIASYLNITPQSLSRIRSNMKNHK